tara:strand:- start:193 stop:1053 length:861 start_codon:yes stop_codon:yes gene_type:complete
MDEAGITGALEMLKTNSFIIKDYILPILIPMLTTVISAILAYKVAMKAASRGELNKQKHQQAHAANSLILHAEMCFQACISRKSFYKNNMSPDLATRIDIFPVITSPSTDKALPIALSELLFLESDISAGDMNWANVSCISRLFNDFLVAENLESRRSVLKLELNELISKSFDHKLISVTKLDLDWMVKEFGSSKTANILTISEQLIGMTDWLLINLNLLIKQIQEIANDRINNGDSSLKYPIIKIDTDHNEFRQSFLVKCPKPNLNRIHELTGLTPQEFESRSRC